MRYARVESNVKPRDQTALIVCWSVFSLAACLGFVILFVLSIVTPHSRKNPVVLSFFLIFVIACPANTILTWTGYVFKDVPFGLCALSGAFGSSVPVLQTSAAICLVIKVWIHTMMLKYPSSVLLRTISSSHVLVALPWIATFPFFLAALIIGAQNPDLVSRASPLYCTFHLTSLNTVMMAVAAIFEIGAVVLAILTGVSVARTRWRAHAVPSGGSGSINLYHLTIRTLIFTGLLTAAFVGNVITSFSNFSNPIPDVINSALSFCAVFVFGSDPAIIATIRGHYPPTDASRGRAVVSISLVTQTHTHRDDSVVTLPQPSRKYDHEWKASGDQADDNEMFPIQPHKAETSDIS